MFLDFGQRFRGGSIKMTICGTDLPDVMALQQSHGIDSGHGVEKRFGDPSWDELLPNLDGLYKHQSEHASSFLCFKAGIVDMDNIHFQRFQIYIFSPSTLFAKILDHLLVILFVKRIALPVNNIRPCTSMT